LEKVSLIWIVVAIVGSLLARYLDDPPLYRLAIITGCFCLWFMWFIVYVSQINPLVAPQLKAQPKDKVNGTFTMKMISV
jgi:hypothetical protein